jgi:hypothetical protein
MFLGACEFMPGPLDPLDSSAGDLSQPPDDGMQPVDFSQPSDGLGNDLLVAPMLSGTRADFTAAVNLTTEGAIDWVHLGLAIAQDVNRKSGASILNTSIVGTPLQYGSYAPTLSWSDGAPTASATTHSGVFVYGMGSGFTVTAPTSTTTRTLRLYVSQDNSTSLFTAHVADGSSADFIKMNTVLSGNFTQVYTIVVRTSAPSTLTASFTNTGTGGDVDLLAVTLQ